MTDEIPLSRDDIEAEIERIENHYDSLDADIEETYKFDGYLKALRLVLGEYEPPELHVASPETVDAIVEDAKQEFPEATIQVERESTPPDYEDIVVRLTNSFEDIDEYMNCSDRMMEIARKHEDEGEIVTTLVRRDKPSNADD